MRTMRAVAVLATALLAQGLEDDGEVMAMGNVAIADLPAVEVADSLDDGQPESCTSALGVGGVKPAEYLVGIKRLVFCRITDFQGALSDMYQYFARFGVADSVDYKIVDH